MEIQSRVQLNLTDFISLTMTVLLCNLDVILLNDTSSTIPTRLIAIPEHYDIYHTWAWFYLIPKISEGQKLFWIQNFGAEKLIGFKNYCNFKT